MDAAAKAFPAWANTPPLKRARILFKFKELLEQNIDKLSLMETQEHGKVLSDAKGSVMIVILCKPRAANFSKILSKQRWLFPRLHVYHFGKKLMRHLI